MVLGMMRVFANQIEKKIVSRWFPGGDQLVKLGKLHPKLHEVCAVKNDFTMFWVAIPDPIWRGRSSGYVLADGLFIFSVENVMWKFLGAASLYTD